MLNPMLILVYGKNLCHCIFLFSFLLSVYKEIHSNKA